MAWLGLKGMFSLQKVIQALLDAGADADAKNDDGDTPLDVAEDVGNSTAIELLR